MTRNGWRESLILIQFTGLSRLIRSPYVQIYEYRIYPIKLNSHIFVINSTTSVVVVLFFIFGRLEKYHNVLFSVFVTCLRSRRNQIDQCCITGNKWLCIEYDWSRWYKWAETLILIIILIQLFSNICMSILCEKKFVYKPIDFYLPTSNLVINLCEENKLAKSNWFSSVSSKMKDFVAGNLSKDPRYLNLASEFSKIENFNIFEMILGLIETLISSSIH